jgi:hypothetical protein
MADAVDHILDGLLTVARSRRKSPDAGQFVVVIRAADGENSIAIANDDSD